MGERFDPEGLRLPIKLDTTSNGEFVPRPLGAKVLAAKCLAHSCVSQAAQRLALTRRQFLKSACGAAATLLAINDAYAGSKSTGGFFDLPRESVFEKEVAENVIGGQEFIFDIQGHHVNPKGSWRRWNNPWTYIFRFFPQAKCGGGAIECLSAEHFIREVFLDSDTDLAVLSAVPAAPEDNPLSTEEAAATRTLVEALDGRQRLMIHGLVHPNLPGAIDTMSIQNEKYGVAAWKTYTQWGPEGTGFWLDDPKVGIPFIEKARELDVKIICVHKGIPLFRLDYEYSTCRDIGAVAKRYPDVSFIVYHSGFEFDRKEGPYNPNNAKGGVDSLIKSLLDHDIPANRNVYAELGSTWRRLMQEPEQAAHVLGKLFKYVGEDNVLWGTDSIWYGSPQDQIQAFRVFQISEGYRERYDYPEITPQLRAKVFGLNAAVPYKVSPETLQNDVLNDRVARVKYGYLYDPEPSFTTNGPKTHREFLRLYNYKGGPL